MSPFQAILDYEKSKGIPPGWVNWSISATNPNGAWQKLERGEVKLDAAFFKEFKADLQNEQRWRTYYAKHLQATRKEQASQAIDEAAYDVPPPPEIDTEWLYWEMMRVAREMDPHMYPALKRLRQHADKSGGKLVIGAMSNTSIFPDGHPYNDESTPEGRQNKELKSMFDVFVSSAHVGMRKPSEDIYYYTVDKLSEFVRQKGYGDGVRPEDFTFLDDIGGNLRTAKKVGMGTIKVTLGRADIAVKELEKVTGLDLTSDKARL